MVTTILKSLPLIFLATIGAVFAFFTGNWLSWNPSGNSTFSAVSNALTVAIFAFSESQLWCTYSMKTFYDNLANVVLSSDDPASTWADPDNVFASIKVAVERKAYNRADIVQEEAIIVLAN